MKRFDVVTKVTSTIFRLLSIGAFTWFTTQHDFFLALFFGVMYLTAVIEDSARRVVLAIREKSAGDALIEALRRPTKGGRWSA